MIVVVKDLFLARSIRERWLIGMMVGLAAALLAWLLVVIPLDRARDRALERHLAAVDRHGRILALAEQARKAPPSNTAAIPSGDLVLLVGDSARSAGLVLDSSAAAGTEQVEVTLARAAPGAALAWLGSLERRGYRIEQLRISSSADGSTALSARIGRAGR